MILTSVSDFWNVCTGIMMGPWEDKGIHTKVRWGKWWETTKRYK